MLFESDLSHFWKCEMITRKFWQKFGFSSVWRILARNFKFAIWGWNWNFCPKYAFWEWFEPFLIVWGDCEKILKNPVFYHFFNKNCEVSFFPIFRESMSGKNLNQEGYYRDNLSRGFVWGGGGGAGVWILGFVDQMEEIILGAVLFIGLPLAYSQHPCYCKMLCALALALLTWTSFLQTFSSLGFWHPADWPQSISIWK